MAACRPHVSPGWPHCDLHLTLCFREGNVPRSGVSARCGSGQEARRGQSQSPDGAQRPERCRAKPNSGRAEADRDPPRAAQSGQQGAVSPGVHPSLQPAQPGPRGQMRLCPASGCPWRSWGDGDKAPINHYHRAAWRSGGCEPSGAGGERGAGGRKGRAWEPEEQPRGPPLAVASKQRGG